MQAVERSRHVVDPVWRVIDGSAFDAVWSTLRQEAVACGFVGLDLEWTTIEVDPLSLPASCEAGSGSGSPPKSTAAPRKPKRQAGPVATVQLSTSSTSFVIKFCDLWHLVKGDEEDVESGWEGDRYAATSCAWPHHRIGEKQNSRGVLSRVLHAVQGLLQDENVVKVGVGIAGDLTKFQRDYPSERISPCVDLVALANHHIHQPIKATIPAPTQSLSNDQLTGDDRGDNILSLEVDVTEIRSLRDMCAAFCGRRLLKDTCVVMSDWGGSLGALSPMQVRYATGDAEVSFDACVGILATAFSEGGGCVNQQGFPARRNWIDFLRPLTIQSKDDDPEAQGNARTTDRKPTAPRKTLTQRLKEYQADTMATEEVPDVGWCKGRAKTYYDNINVYDPKMNLVFTVDQSKAEWYVYKKGLAKVIEWRTAAPEDKVEGRDMAEPEPQQMASIQLSFTPDFRKFNDAHVRRNLAYFQQPKENVCVVCGNDHALVRFAVIPMMYRKYFPSVYMSHNSYDLLLLCTLCFAKSRGIYEAERSNVSKDFGIPLSHLTPTRLAAFEREIAAFEGSLVETPEDGRDAMSNDAEDDLVAHHLSRELRLKVMKEFAEMERHHDCLITVLKYAKALHGHYITTGLDAGKSLTGDRRFCIPAEKVALMQAFVREEAPRYYFPTALAEGTDSADTPSPMGIDDPASAEGVRWILTGELPSSESTSTVAAGAAERSPSEAASHAKGDSTTDEDSGYEDRSPGSLRLRIVLTEFWLREHPEIAAYVPRTVRAEERNETPLVDSHGFFVARMLMEKYAGSTTKNGEHAIGQFIYRWRRVFLDKLQPKHLPTGWVAEDGILR